MIFFRQKAVSPLISWLPPPLFFSFRDRFDEGGRGRRQKKKGGFTFSCGLYSSAFSLLMRPWEKERKKDVVDALSFPSQNSLPTSRFPPHNAASLFSHGAPPHLMGASVPPFPLPIFRLLPGVFSGPPSSSLAADHYIPAWPLFILIPHMGDDAGPAGGIFCAPTHYPYSAEGRAKLRAPLLLPSIFQLKWLYFLCVL